MIDYPDDAEIEVGEEEYQYPEGLDLHPQSEFHAKLLDRLLGMAQESKSAMSSRYTSWNYIDRTSCAYTPKDEDERVIKEQDPRKPVSLVVPATYAIMKTAITYLQQELLGGDIYFPIEAKGPEDVIGCVLLQHELQQQALMSKMELALNVQWMDTFKYGIGILVPRWTKQMRRRRARDIGGAEGLLNFSSRVDERVVDWEGNSLDSVDPYLWLPDPNVPVQNIQKGLYVGWVSRENRLNILTEEQEDLSDFCFNARYLREFEGSSVLAGDESARFEREDSEFSRPSSTTGLYSENVDVLNIMVNLIPSEWGIGKGRYPEKWVFRVGNDRIILGMGKLELFHDLFPVVITASNFDGYSISPFGTAELLYPLQEVLDFLFSSFVMDLRKNVNGKTIIDQYRLNFKDLKKPEIGYVRLNQPAMGLGVDSTFRQMDFRMSTEQNLSRAQYVISVMERTAGINNILQGMFSEDAPERRTKEEVQRTTNSSLSRMSHDARMCFTMGLRDLVRMLASNTIQYKSERSFVRLSGDWPRILLEEYDGLDSYISGDRLNIDPKLLDVNYDIIPFNPKKNSKAEDPQTMMTLFQQAVTVPQLQGRFDVIRLYKSLARRLGETNIDQFEIKAQVLPDEQVMNQVDQGRLQAV